MPKVDKKSLPVLLSQTRNIRNVCVISHVGYGKTSFAREIINSAGQQQGEDRDDPEDRARAQEDADLGIYEDDGETDSEGETSTKNVQLTTVEEIPRTATTFNTFVYDVSELDRQYISESSNGNGRFLFSLVDPSGDVDLNQEVSSALRVTDGCIVIVDCVTGIRRQTESLMKLAIAEQSCPVLLVSRLDLSILSLELEPEELCVHLARLVNTFNRIMEMHGGVQFQVDPSQGSVAFGSGIQGWAFTVHEFARMYTKKFKIEFREIKEKLWGDNFYNQADKKWTTNAGSKATRGFIQFVLTPLYTVLNVCTRKGRDEIFKFVDTMDIELSVEEKQMKRAELIKVVMRKWLPAGKTLLDMCVFHLPSPVTAQAKRVNALYREENSKDAAANDVRSCDPKGCLVMYVTRMVPSRDRGRMYSFGRIFSGTVRKGQTIYLIGPKQFAWEKKESCQKVTVSSVNVFYDGMVVATEKVTCGNICGIVGLKMNAEKSGTVTTQDKAPAMKPMTYKVAQVVGLVVEAHEIRHHPRLIEEAQRLDKQDPSLQVDVSRGGEIAIWGVNEFHLNKSVALLKEQLGSTKVQTTGPHVPYKETVAAGSSKTCTSKSPDRQNSISITAQTLPEECVTEIEQGVIGPFQNVTERATLLNTKYKISLEQAKRIVCFGPNAEGPNLLLDGIRMGREYWHHVESTVIAAFQSVTKKGALCDESTRGVLCRVQELYQHDPHVPPSTKEIFAAAVSAFKGAMLSAKPRIVEPVYRVEIRAPDSESSTIFSIITKRHGLVTKEISVKDWENCCVEAEIPVANAFGLAKELASKTNSAAVLAQCVFHHWSTLPGTPLDYRSKVTSVVRQVRRRKGLDPEVPLAEDYQD